MITRWFFFALLACTLAIGCNNTPTERIVVIETEFGTMKAKLYNSTPQHRDNFVKLVESKYYDDLLFHRIIKGFMVQGGDPDSKGAAPAARLGMGGPGYTIPAEIGSPHFKGTLAAARTGGPSNPDKESSGSQFYIVHGTPQTAESLEVMGKQKGIAYSQAHIDKYVQLGGTPMLDMEYTVFGELISGMDVVDKIAAVQTGQQDRPVSDVKMTIRMDN